MFGASPKKRAAQSPEVVIRTGSAGVALDLDGSRVRSLRYASRMISRGARKSTKPNSTTRSQWARFHGEGVHDQVSGDDCAGSSSMNLEPSLRRQPASSRTMKPWSSGKQRIHRGRWRSAGSRNLDTRGWSQRECDVRLSRCLLLRPDIPENRRQVM